MRKLKRRLLLTAIFLTGLALPFSSIGSQVNPHKEAQDKLLGVLSRQLPKSMKLRLENFHTRFQIPPTATFSILNPHPPVGLVNFQAQWPHSGFTKKVMGSVTVRASAPIAVARGPIRPGEAFSDENVAFEWREINPFLSTGYFLQPEKVYSLRANGYLRVGSVLGISNTSVPSAVQAGESVSLIMERGGLRIVAKVKALESGQIKNWVKVENPSSKKRMLARVSAPGEVTLR